MSKPGRGKEFNCRRPACASLQARRKLLWLRRSHFGSLGSTSGLLSANCIHDFEEQFANADMILKGSVRARTGRQRPWEQKSLSARLETVFHTASTPCRLGLGRAMDL